MRHLLLAGVLFAAIACTGSTEPPGGRQESVFHLATVDHEPPPKIRLNPWDPAPTIQTRGDLVLRADGTFALSLPYFDSTMATFAVGAATRRGAELQLAAPLREMSQAITVSATHFGDSIVTTYKGKRFAFHQGVSPADLPPGTYVLHDSRGRSDSVVVGHWTDGTRELVVYDTIQVLDGLFHRRAYAYTITIEGTGWSEAGMARYHGIYSSAGAEVRFHGIYGPVTGTSGWITYFRFHSPSVRREGEVLRLEAEAVDDVTFSYRRVR